MTGLFGSGKEPPTFDEWLANNQIIKGKNIHVITLKRPNAEQYDFIYIDKLISIGYELISYTVDTYWGTYPTFILRKTDLVK